MQYQIELKLPVSLPPTRSTPVVIVDEAEYLAMQQRIRELEQQVEDDHVAATIQLQALTIERDDARQRMWSTDKWWHEVQQVKGTAKIAGNNVDYMELADAEELFEKVITDYGQRIQELEAELARLREQQWEPVEDGFEYACACQDCIEHDEAWRQKVYVNRNELGICYLDSINEGEQYIMLPDNIRLCRRNADAQPQPASVPDEVLDWLKRLVLAKENEMLCYIQRYNYEANSTQLATCRAALAWLDAQPPQATAPDNDVRD